MLVILRIHGHLTICVFVVNSEANLSSGFLQTLACTWLCWTAVMALITAQETGLNYVGNPL